MFRCSNCNGIFNIEEGKGFDINGNVVSIDENSMDRNINNPDYCVKILCNECEEE